MEQSRLQRHPSPMPHPVSNLRTSSSSRLQSKKQSLQRMQKVARNRQKCRSRAPRFVSLDQWLGLSRALPQTNLPNARQDATAAIHALVGARLFQTLSGCSPKEALHPGRPGGTGGRADGREARARVMGLGGTGRA